MKLLLTSAGISNKSILNALAGLLGKPVPESNALFVPTAIYGIPRGGDCQYLTYWMQRSGLADLLPSLLQKTVYVGLSAGSMIMTRYGTTYGNHTLPPDSDKALGLVDIALHPHLDHEMFPENSQTSLEKLAATLPMPSYLIDDQSD